MDYAELFDTDIVRGYCTYIEQELLDQKQYEWLSYKKFPKQSGIYVIRDIAGQIVYIGETSNIHDRLTHHQNANGSALKNKIADFTQANPNSYLYECTIACLPMLLGRAEVEKYLIDKYDPIFNNYNLRKRNDKFCNNT